MKHIARWAMISRLNPEGLDFIHKKELEAHEKQKETGSKKCMELGLPMNDAILHIGSDILSRAQIRHGSFWPRNTPRDHKEREMERFRNRIYPIWKPLEDRSREDGTDSILVVHEVDRKVLKLGFDWRLKENVSAFRKPGILVNDEKPEKPGRNWGYD